MDIEETIEIIVDNGRVEDMHELSDILEDTMKILEEYYPDKYKKYETKLYEMAYGCILNKAMAKEIVSNMKPYGEKWDINETTEILRQYGINARETDFYAVMNMAWNDYNDIFRDDIEMYIRFANDFINDDDAKEDKVYLYFMTIPK